jgi:hypothetical protein
MLCLIWGSSTELTVGEGIMLNVRIQSASFKVICGCVARYFIGSDIVNDIDESQIRSMTRVAILLNL